MPDLSIEKKKNNLNYKLIAGVDEAGRGPWAGPVYSAAVILDTANIPEEINDSKKMSQNIKKGNHIIQLFGSENCCDGTSHIRFRRNGGVWKNMTKANLEEVAKEKPQKSVVCNFTVDNVVDSVKYNGQTLDFTGDGNNWNKSKTFTFDPNFRKT